MKFSWGHIFSLAEKLLDINQSKIAEYLGVHRSTISKLENGKQPRFKMGKKDLYEKLFDPDNDIVYNHVRTRKTDDLLTELKEIIHEAKWDDLTEIVKADSYKDFVMGLIDLAVKNQPKRPTRQKDDSYPAIQNEYLNQPSVSAKDMNDSYESKINIPSKYNTSKYKVCFYCKNWRSNNRFINTCASGVYGTCMKYDIETLSTSHKLCKDFLLNESQLTSDILCKGFQIGN